MKNNSRHYFEIVTVWCEGRKLGTNPTREAKRISYEDRATVLEGIKMTESHPDCLAVRVFEVTQPIPGTRCKTKVKRIN